MSSTAEVRSLSLRQSNEQAFTPLHVPTLDDSEPAHHVVFELNNVNINDKDDVVEEGEALFKNFLFEEIKKEPTHVLDTATKDLEKNFPRYKNPVWAQVGYEFRQMADQFARTQKRKRVRQRAREMGVDVTYDQFRDLMSELFAEGGVTPERILVLFYFCSDVVINALQKGNDLFQQFISWSLRFIAEHVCQWVNRHGGWAQILKSQFSLAKKICIFACVSLAAFAVIRYVRPRYFLFR